MYVDPDPRCEDEGWETAASVLVPVATTAVAWGAFMATYGVERYLDYAAMLGEHGALLQFVVMAGVVAVHGALHAVAFVAVGALSVRDITVDLVLRPENGRGVRACVLPAVPMRRWAYHLGVAVPGVFLGALPVVVALVTGNPLAMFVGVVGLLTTPGDVQVLLDAWRHRETVPGAISPG